MNNVRKLYIGVNPSDREESYFSIYLSLSSEARAEIDGYVETLIGSVRNMGLKSAFCLVMDIIMYVRKREIESGEVFR